MASVTTRSNRLLTRLGFSASTICAIHCMAMPFMFSVLPTLGLGFLASGWFEVGMIGISVAIGAVTLGTSYRMHRSINPIVMLASGIVVLLFNFIGHESHSELAETLHPYIAAFGALMIANSYRINRKLCASCESCEHDHDHGHEASHTHATSAEPAACSTD